MGGFCLRDLYFGTVFAGVIDSLEDLVAFFPDSFVSVKSENLENRPVDIYDIVLLIYDIQGILD